MYVKVSLLAGFIFLSTLVKAQKVEHIHVNLYTDSLKKGTFNYINIDGELANGKFLPLDSSEVTFWASEGKFSGNNLWIDKDARYEKVLIRVALKANPQLNKEFTMFIKKKPDDEKLKSEDELLNDMKKSKKKSRSNTA